LYSLCIISLCISGAFSQIKVRKLYPLQDPNSKGTKELKDYDMLKPLHEDGSDFSCKGYQWNTPLTPVATYCAGEIYELELKGGATHGRGSCQIALSCDNGVHFQVLKSIIGGCPVRGKYNFKIPDSAESARCLLGWTWSNRVGNRAMYMHCAVVDIVGAQELKKKRDVEDPSDSEASNSVQTALSMLPSLLVANLKGVNDCRTKEIVVAVSPDPGDDVVY
ncbi:uncharacterized protein BDR25DRAFT_190868, partial [Lindgomyces ingoldianus]